MSAREQVQDFGEVDQNMAAEVDAVLGAVVPEHYFVVPPAVVAMTLDGQVNVPRTAQLAVNNYLNR